MKRQHFGNFDNRPGKPVPQLLKKADSPAMIVVQLVIIFIVIRALMLLMGLGFVAIPLLDPSINYLIGLLHKLSEFLTRN